MDWSHCQDVEQVSGKMSGAWVVKGTRVPVEAILENFRAGFSAETISQDIFPTVPLDRLKRVIDFAGKHEAHPA